jgi:ABC-type branched-subunit amino acid transport system ATPase component/ABC-type branched-subunit amino acid transport system permease subunit
MSRLFANALLSLPLIGAYSMFALGIVVTYRASRVLNLAHGALATVPAYVGYSLSHAGMQVGYIVPITVATGAVLGLLVERFVLRPLRDESPTAQTVGTVAVLGLLLSLVAVIWGTESLNAPNVFPAGRIRVGHSVLQYGEIGLAITAILVAAAFAALFRYTGFGLAMRGAAENRRAVTLMGVDPDKTTAAAWAIGGALAAAGGVMLAGVGPLRVDTLSRQVLPAFVAVLIGGLGSLGGSLVGAAIVGLAMGVIPAIGPLGDQAGSEQLALAIVAFVVMATRGQRLAGAAELARASGRITASRRAKLPKPAVALIGVALLALPWFPLDPAIRDAINRAGVLVVVAVALVILTGWVGQISLGHASFVGLAAFTTGVLVRNAGIPFPLNLPLAAGAAAAAAALLGLVALRVRGLYLAVATLIFGWMADAWLFRSRWLVGEGGSSTITARTIGRAGHFLSFNFTDRRIFYYLALAAAALALVGAANLRDSRTGRAFFAVRGSEVAAASLGINVARTKLFAFAISGLLAGVAGNLTMTGRLTASATAFSLDQSLFFLAIAVVGGLWRLGGAVAAALLFASIEALFFHVTALGGYLDVVSSGLLLGAVLFSSAPARARLDGLRRSKRDARAQQGGLVASPVVIESATQSHPTSGGTALEVSDVVVRFGGLVAANHVSLDVGAGEIVGLIGPNGAGKTTLFNAISGLVQANGGRVTLFGHDATALGVHERAALGLGRTFQVIQLFQDASVFDNILVGTHQHSGTGPLSHLFVTDRSLADERAARERVEGILDLVGLNEVAHVAAGDLPFGVQRMVEIGRALVTGAQLILLDEPASGLDDRETQRLADLIESVRKRLATALLVVEHDVRFVTRLSDRLFVLDQGRIIASGTPAEVQRDPAVLAAYLGSTETGDENDGEPALVGVS